MPGFDIGAAATAGFRLVGRHFGAVVIWGVVSFALAIIPFLLSIPQYMEAFRIATDGAGAAPPSSNFGNPMASVISLPFALVSMVLIQAALCRAVVAPQQGGFGFIRVGTAELLLAVYLVAFFIAFVLLIAVAAFVFGLLAVAMRESTSSLVLIGIPYWIAVSVGFIWLSCRLALVGPSIVANGELRLGEAWAMTKGRVGSLFLTGLLNVVILIGLVLAIYILLIVVVLIVGGVAAATMGGAASNPADIASAMRNMGPMVIALIAVFGLLFLIGYILIGAIFQALAYAPWADVYRQLARPDTAQTFA